MIRCIMQRSAVTGIEDEFEQSSLYLHSLFTLQVGASRLAVNPANRRMHTLHLLSIRIRRTLQAELDIFLECLDQKGVRVYPPGGHMPLESGPGGRRVVPRVIARGNQELILLHQPCTAACI